MTQVIVNPFNILSAAMTSESSSSSDSLASHSSVRNEIPGQCPKCSIPMDTVSIGYSHSQKTEPVFWCATCKVTTPKPEA